MPTRPETPYANYEQLDGNRDKGVDFAVRSAPRESPFAIVAPHGGKIELGTSELAEAIAGEEHTLYLFEGLRSGSWALHIPSEAYDEPGCLKIVRSADTVVTIHGLEGDSKEVRIGGLDESLRLRMEAELTTAGFAASRTRERRIAGRHPNNLCNRGSTGRGCQLEIGHGLRGDMFRDLTSRGRKEPTEQFHKFVNAVRKALR